MTLVVRNDSDGLAVLTLNRPAKLNSLTIELLDQLLAHIEDIERSVDIIGVVLLRGAGRSFCAGNDIDSIASGTGGRPIDQARIVGRLAALPQPVVAAVHGHCFTGGLELALAADIILASENALFADTHARWGLTPMWGMSQRLPRRIGQAKAIEMMATGRRYGGRTAAEMGLANLCFAADRFEAETDAFVREMVVNSWLSHREAKRMMRETDAMPLARGLAHEIDTHFGVSSDAVRRLAEFRARG